MPDLNDQNALHRINSAVHSLPQYPPNIPDTPGIVICGGGTRYFICAWVCINILRKLGCQLPVELWHLGPAEMNSAMRRLVEPLNVRPVDAYEIRRQHPVRILNGWELKPYAILHSSFRHVISLDADNVPLIDPQSLLDTPEYRQHGAIFWPDYGRLNRDRMIWPLTGVPYRDEPEFESGQIVIDKSRSWRPLNLTMWMNEHSDFWYRHVHGDKDTFHLAWRKLDQPYAMPTRSIHSLHCTMCQHDFHDKIIFQHRNLAKWTLRGNRRIEGFAMEDDCLAFIDALGPYSTEVFGASLYSPKSRTPAEQAAAQNLTARQWVYRRVGHDQRPMTFKEDGTIGAGAAGLEVFWDIAERNHSMTLDIQSEESLTCRLNNTPDGIWRGQWERFEQMPIELRPVSNTVS